MTARRSIARRLFLGLTAVGMTGTLLLLIFIIREHQQTFRALGEPKAAGRAFTEVYQHVLVPILVLIIPMGLASFIVIRRALKPLGEAAERLHGSQPHARGVLVDHAAFPAEAVPFAEAVNTLLSQLDQAARDHEAFAADVAHELRTPLAVLSLELDGLDHPDAPRLKADVLAMRRLTDQLMLLARVEAHKVAQPMPEEVDLVETGADVVSLLAPAAIAEGKNLSLVLRGGRNLVTGQRETIAAALRNLVENALRVTPAMGSVTVFAGPGPRLSVRDGGAGLPPERLARLAQRHSRADHASEGGAGLGLAIVARIMEAHGGMLATVPDARELVLEFGR